MNGQPKLYTPELLACAVRLANYPLREAFPLMGDARSTACGSTLSMGMSCDELGRVDSLGVKAQACAVGQAAAAVFADSATGMTAQEIDRSAAALRHWLSDAEATPPEWPGLMLLESARAYPARHGAIMLAWDAALRALSIGSTDR